MFYWKKGRVSNRPFWVWLCERRHSPSFAISSLFTIYLFLTLQHLNQSYSGSYGGQRGGQWLAASPRLPHPIITGAHILGGWAPTHLPSGWAQCSADSQWVMQGGEALLSTLDLAYTEIHTDTHTHTTYMHLHILREPPEEKKKTGCDVWCCQEGWRM